MKNPWMSFWLSAANAQMSVARGVFAANLARAQKAAVEDMTRQTIAFWTGGAAPAPSKTPRKARRRARA